MSRLRQLVLCAKDIDSAATTICNELDTYVTWRDPQIKAFGLQNVLIPIGGEFLEIVAPIVENVTADRYLKKFGDGGYMAIIQLKDANELRLVEQRVNENNVRIIHYSSRTVHDDSQLYDNHNGVGFGQPGIAGIHLHPHDVGCITEVTNMIPSNKWLWAGVKWESQNEELRISKSKIRGFAGVTIAVNNPRETYLLWSKLLGFNENVQVENDSIDNCITLRDNSKVRFVKKRNKKENGVIGIDVYSLATKLKHSKQLCGVIFTFWPVYNMLSKL